MGCSYETISRDFSETNYSSSRLSLLEDPKKNHQYVLTVDCSRGVGQDYSAAVVVDHYENKGYSIGFAVNDNLSISFTEEESTKKQKSKATATDVITRSDKTMEIQTIDVAYTVGGATFSVSTSEGTNDSYTTGDDTNEHIFAMSLAF